MKTLTWRKRYEQIAWKRGRRRMTISETRPLAGCGSESLSQKRSALLSTDEAQALANANQVLKISPYQRRSSKRNRKQRKKALCDALDNRRTQARRRKGVAPGNKAKADEAAARKRICVKFYKKKCSGKKNPPTKSQVYRDLRNQWLSLRGKTDLKPPAKSTFMGYVADL